MSEINELIATSSTHAYNAGTDAERKRVVKILNGKVVDALFYGKPETASLIKEAIKEIKGENYGKDGRAARAAE
jgi:hypothetical protein